MIDAVAEIGIEMDAEHVLLSSEMPVWNKEKLSRPESIAKTHRVITLFAGQTQPALH